METAEESGSMLPHPPLVPPATCESQENISDVNYEEETSESGSMLPHPPLVPPATCESQENINYEEETSMEVLNASEGTLIIMLIVVGAILVLCDTRSTRGTGGKTVLDDGEGTCTARSDKPHGKWSERVVPKILQAAYCIMAGTGQRHMSLGLHKMLSAHLEELAKARRPKPLSRLLMNRIEKMVPKITHPDGKERPTKFRVATAMWDNEESEHPVARIYTLDAADEKAVDHTRTRFCCLGDQDHIAHNIITSKLDAIKSENRSRLTYNEGRDLLNQAMDAAASKSSGRVGGRKKLCVIQPRDAEELQELLDSNLSKRLLRLDRSVTFMDLGEIPESRPPVTSSSTSISSRRDHSGVEGKVAGRKAGEDPSASRAKRRKQE